MTSRSQQPLFDHRSTNLDDLSSTTTISSSPSSEYYQQLQSPSSDSRPTGGFFKRLMRCDRHTCFTFNVLIALMICTIGCIFGLIFIPTQPRYSLCNENIHWNSILNSIIKLGYASANITVHASLYNPNRFNIELRRLQLSFYYKNEFFGHASISRNQGLTELKDTFSSLSLPSPSLLQQQEQSQQFQQSNFSHSRFNDDLDITPDFGLDLPPAQQDSEYTTATPYYSSIENNVYEYLGLDHYYESPFPSISPSILNTVIQSFSPQIDRKNGYSNKMNRDMITDNNKDQHKYQLFTSDPSPLPPPLPIITLTGGNITDVFLDAIFEPTMKQAIDMAGDYAASSLFVSVKVQYDTSVFAWYTPRINYNATSQFDNIDITGGGAHGDGDENYCLCQGGII